MHRSATGGKKVCSQVVNPATLIFHSFSSGNLRQNWLFAFDAFIGFCNVAQKKKQRPITGQMINLIRNQCFPPGAWLPASCFEEDPLPWGHGALATPTLANRRTRIHTLTKKKTHALEMWNVHSVKAQINHQSRQWNVKCSENVWIYPHTHTHTDTHTHTTGYVH